MIPLPYARAKCVLARASVGVRLQVRLLRATFSLARARRRPARQPHPSLPPAVLPAARHPHLLSMGERPVPARPSSPSSRSSGSLQQLDMVEISIPSPAAPAPSSTSTARLLYSKSHVYVHPTPFSAGNVCGYVSVVEQSVRPGPPSLAPSRGWAAQLRHSGPARLTPRELAWAEPDARPGAQADSPLVAAPDAGRAPARLRVVRAGRLEGRGARPPEPRGRARCVARSPCASPRYHPRPSAIARTDSADRRLVPLREQTTSWSSPYRSAGTRTRSRSRSPTSTRSSPTRRR